MIRAQRRPRVVALLVAAVVWSVGAAATSAALPAEPPTSAAAPAGVTGAAEPAGVTGAAEPSGVPAAAVEPGGAGPLAIDPAVTDALADGDVEVIVQAHPDRLDQARAAVAAGGGVVHHTLEIIDGFSATLTADALTRLETSETARSVSLDGEVQFSHTAPAGQDYDDTTFVETVRAHRLHRDGVTGRGVGIAILDTGVSPVADVRGRLVGGIDLTVEGDGVDRYGHGTFIAGVAAGDGAASGGRHAGVAPGAHVVPIKIAGRNGASDVSQVLAAMEWVVSHRDTYDIGVLNLSFGTDSRQSQRHDPMNMAVERVWDAGVVVVAAAANLGPGAGTIMKPGDDPLVITVGATDFNGSVGRQDDTIPDFSSRGPTPADGFAKPDLVAPGAHIIGLRAPNSTIDRDHPYARVDNAYFRGSGTSFSTGVVSGAVALLREAHPDWTPDQIKGALLSTATPGPTGDRMVEGHGMVHVLRAHQLTDPAPANVGVVRSDGTGTLEASRGSLQLAIVTDPVTNTVGLLFSVLQDPVGSVLKVLSGELTVQDALFDADEYREDWQGRQWYGRQWYGRQWYGTEWNGRQWYGRQWYADDWR